MGSRGAVFKAVNGSLACGDAGVKWAAQWLQLMSPLPRDRKAVRGRILSHCGHSNKIVSCKGVAVLRSLGLGECEAPADDLLGDALPP